MLPSNYQPPASKLILSYADSYVVDSISFGAQTKDISYLRCPNGSGTFKLYTPSFGAENCLTTALGEVNLNNQAEALKAIVFQIRQMII